MGKTRLQDVLMDALAIGRERGLAEELSIGLPQQSRAQAPGDLPELQRVIAELGSDWVFMVQLNADGTPAQQWFGGAAAAAGLDLQTAKLVAGEEGAATEHFLCALRTGSDRSEYPLNFSDGGIRWVESALCSIWGERPEDPLTIYGTMRDITGHRATEEALRTSESLYRALVEQASDGILVFEDSGQIIASNSAAHELFGLDQRELHQCKFESLFHPDDIDRDPLSVANLASGITLRSVRRLRRQGDDEFFWAELSARRLVDGRIQATARDITSRMEAERRIRNLAYFDSLTGLPNRELFREQIEQALERCRRSDKQLALLFLDIDRFKQVNDSLGHSSGDLLLQQVADRLRTVVRGSDSISLRLEDDAAPGEKSRTVSRLGGDEFTILIQDLEHSQDAARVARRVLHSLSGVYTVSEQEVFVGSSIGIAVWPEDGADSEVLLQSADTAMYHAKKRGGNTYQFFNSSMNAVSARRLRVETGLRRALERNEFKLVYQPIRDVATGRLSAAEALLRWVDSDGESIGPDEFIPIAEETGLIVEIGAWILRTACLQARDWKAAGYKPFRMSVNVAVGQLSDLGIVEGVDQVLFESKLSPCELELEITESSILDDNPNIIAAISRLTDMGIGFALDDFGTGYSSLSALQRFPIERLKIDRSFVSGVDKNDNDQALASAIVALAKRLDLRVVAEGVETEAQARFLVELGCDEFQGYLFSRPLPPDEFEAFLELEAKFEAGKSTDGQDASDQGAGGHNAGGKDANDRDSA